MLLRLTKIFQFEMAHALPGYDGACRHIHGHTFTLEVTVRGRPLEQAGHPKNGMVLDFKDLKSVVKTHFVDTFDHALALPNTVAPEVLAALQSEFGRVVVLPAQPTCEYLIHLCVQAIMPVLPSGVELWHIRLAETASSYASWWAEDNG